MFVEHQLPANLDAERATLGSVLMDRDAIVPLAGFLQPGHFYLEKHRWIFDAMLRCYARRVPPDLQLVAEDLRKRDQLALVGDIPFLASLADSVSTAYHVEHYARVVADAAVRRDMIAAGGRIAALGYDEALALPDVRGRAQELLNTVGDPADGGAVHSHEQVISRHYDGYAERGKTTTFTSGIVEFDARIRLLPGRVITLAAPTGHGKTSFAETIADNIARQGGNVLYWSGEVPAEQMHDRRLCRLYGLRMEALETGTLGDGEIQLYHDACNHIAAWRGGVHIYDRSADVARIRAAAARQQATTGLDLVVVDHLQLLTRKPKQSNYDAITQACQELKQMALDLRVPVLQLSQLSREFRRSGDKRPQVWHLKESGEIENSSDAVVLLWFDEDTEARLRPGPGIAVPDSFEVTAHGAVEKNRQGRRGDFGVSYVAGRFWFRG